MVGVKRDGYQKERYLEHCPVVADDFIVGRVWNGGSQNEKSPLKGHKNSIPELHNNIRGGVNMVNVS